MEKCFYAYCKPKINGHPWTLERIPFGRTILTSSKQVIKSGKSINLGTKVIDDVGVSLNNGTISLPVNSKYLVSYTIYSSEPINLKVRDLSITSTSGDLVIESTDVLKSFEFTNKSDKSLNIDGATLLITKI